MLTPLPVGAIQHARLGDRPQGVAGDCNSLEATHAWFDSRVAHHFFFFRVTSTCRSFVTISSGFGRLLGKCFLAALLNAAEADFSGGGSDCG
ncbi:hypothetical protein ACMU_14680 [Actibacterium mucosum KCTC 23349]|uniref:Uncharacterized protein n=1 Tax=Actibacterium mucosum KCTC 23349 TaxID=1454373 RepID=A0A037ZJL2_9RHOB|nr:hypothetical protein ACMU_14680 [Actibacterium mucosum KCTC 23349]